MAERRRRRGMGVATEAPSVVSRLARAIVALGVVLPACSAGDPERHAEGGVQAPVVVEEEPDGTIEGAGEVDDPCSSYMYSTEAQAVLDSDPSDSEGLDNDGDGLACETLAAGPSDTPGVDPLTSTSQTIAESGAALGNLDVRLELDDTTLAPGESTRGHLVIENPTATTIVDPTCALVSIQFGLVPAEQPDAPLTGVVEVECDGGASIAPGATVRFNTGADFTAMEPGDYLAIVSHQAGIVPLIVRVTVTSD